MALIEKFNKDKKLLTYPRFSDRGFFIAGGEGGPEPTPTYKNLNYH